MIDFGADVSCDPDLDVTGRVIEGELVLMEHSLRRLTTKHGALEYDPDFGFDLRDYLNEDLDDEDLPAIQLGAAHELEKDERVSRANVSITLDKATFTLTPRIELETIDGDIVRFTLGIDQVSATILKPE